MEKKMIEIGLSTGLVALLILALVAVNMAPSQDLRAPASVTMVLLFMISMGVAGLKLMDF